MSIVKTFFSFQLKEKRRPQIKVKKPELKMNPEKLNYSELNEQV